MNRAGRRTASLAFGSMGKDGLHLSGLSGPLSGAKACYISCDDYLYQSIVLPRLSAGDREGFIRMRLSRYFPDPAADNPFSSLGRPVSGRAQVVYSAAATMAAYREACPEARFICLLGLGRPPQEGLLRIVLGPGWTEHAFFRGGEWSPPARLQTKGMEEIPPQAILPEAASGSGHKVACIEIYYADSLRDAAQALGAALRASSGARLVVKPLAEAIKGPMASRGLFQPPRSARGRSVAMAATLLGALIIVSANVFLYRLGLEAASQADSLEGRLRDIQAELRREAELSKELKALRASIDEASPAAAPAHSILSAFAMAAGPGARVIEFNYQDGRFTMTAEARDALSCYGALEKTDAFAGLSLSSIQPLESGERFVLRGQGRETP
jgi:hypothetical protein